jgi:hypothetical protein
MKKEWTKPEVLDLSANKTESGDSAYFVEEGPYYADTSYVPF